MGIETIIAHKTGHLYNPSHYPLTTVVNSLLYHYIYIQVCSIICHDIIPHTPGSISKCYTQNYTLQPTLHSEGNYCIMVPETPI